MWKVFPKLGLLKLLFVTFCGLFLAVLIELLPMEAKGGNLSWHSFLEALSFAIPVMFLFLGIVYVVGRWGWQLLWKAPRVGKILHTKFCPDLNGRWDGLIESTHLDENGTAINTEVTLKIQADLFSIEIGFDSDDGYQSSRVVQCDIYKNPRNSRFYLSYIFESNVPDPKQGDEGVFQGAAQLHIDVMNENSTELKGTYWTNRMWKEGKQTAGRLTATRVNR